MATTRPPGYEARQHLRQQLPLLSPQKRAAFLAACAERVLPILQNYTGRLSPFDEAISLAWSFALGGEADTQALATIVDACSQEMDDLYADDETGATLRAASAVHWTAKSIQEPQPLSWEQAMSDAQGAADVDDPQRGDTFIAEEADWQLEALAIASTTDRPFREMFDPIKHEPTWLRIYRQEKWIQR